MTNKAVQLCLLGILLIFTSCNPCRKIQKHPDRYQPCFDATVKIKADTGSAPLADRDSSVNAADSALMGLRDTVFKYITVIQDCNSTPEQKEKAKKKIADQFPEVRKVIDTLIINAPCLTDTATFNDKGGATLKLWQDGKEIKYSLTYPVTEYNLKENHWPWWVWLLIGYGLAMLTLAGLIVWSKK